MTRRKKILLLDDDVDFCLTEKALLEKKGYQVFHTDSSEKGLPILQREAPFCVLLDLHLGAEDGLEVLQKIRTENERIPVIILTGHETVDSAVEAMKRGAFHYMRKSAGQKELLVLLEKAVEQIRLQERLESMERELGGEGGLEEKMGNSPPIREVVRVIRSVAETNVSVLITGESGTGKELVARSIHRLSSRREGPFVPIDCASIPETLIESELFGHEKGAYTGADQTTTGKFESANGGTVFLDEVANIPVSVQAKLLRFLEGREFERVGGRSPIKTSIRILAATNEDLRELSEKGGFRMDLYYRLNEFPILLPPLRERREDIPLLCHRLLSEVAREMGKDPIPISPEGLAHLRGYHFPGNVRELRNLLKRAMVVAEDRIEPEHLPIKKEESLKELMPEAPQAKNLREASRLASLHVEKKMILNALEKTAGHHEKASQLLGITPRTLYNKIKELDIKA